LIIAQAARLRADSGMEKKFEPWGQREVEVKRMLCFHARRPERKSHRYRED